RAVEQGLEVERARTVRDERARAQGPEWIERRGNDEQDREQGEHAGPQRHQVAPAHASEPRLTGHRLISSRAAVRRKPMIETGDTIRKVTIRTGAPKPYWAPPAAKASL